MRLFEFLVDRGATIELKAIPSVQTDWPSLQVVFEQALKETRKALGDEHPRTAVSLNNLACLYYAQWEFGKAEPLLKESVQIRTKTLSGDDPQVALSLSNLGAVHIAMR